LTKAIRDIDSRAIASEPAQRRGGTIKSINKKCQESWQ
jgi:hypothetical protein